jgi:hypothetical protein
MSFPLRTLDKSTWITLSIGFVLALMVYHILWIQIFIYPIVTVAHEIGHTAVGWLFGYPSFPSFRQDGGVTLHRPQNASVLLGIYLGFAILLPIYRRNNLTLCVLLVSLGGYSVIAFTSLSKALILFMGHGMELLLAGWLLYLALTNFSQWLCPVFAMLGIFIVMYDFSFAYKLMYDSTYQMIYTYQQGGNNLGDFSQLAQKYFGGNVSKVANLFLWCCCLTPILSYMLFRYQNVIIYRISQCNIKKSE